MVLHIYMDPLLSKSESNPICFHPFGELSTTLRWDSVSVFSHKFIQQAVFQILF